MQEPSERHKLTSDNNIIKFKSQFMTPLNLKNITVPKYFWIQPW